MHTRVSYNIQELLTDNNADSVITLLKWIIKGKQNTVFSGNAGVGKTTILKSCIAFSDNGGILFRDEVKEIAKSKKYINHDLFIEGISDEDKLVSVIIKNHNYRSIHFDFYSQTADELIERISQKLTANKSDALKMTVDKIRVNCHMVLKNRNRYLERVTEIIPIKDEYGNNSYLMQNIFEWQNGKYVLVNMPSETMINNIKSSLTKAERITFEAELENIRLSTERN